MVFWKEAVIPEKGGLFYRVYLGQYKERDEAVQFWEKLDEEGVSMYLGYYEEVSIRDIKKAVQTLIADGEKRKKMSEKGKKLIDGRGVDRVVREVKELIKDVGVV